ncbi:hypothetical protein G9A89_006646 [Geosiphon pyriformis]|nr:hypothetical protein G9A89_006646 [Geosiphon pyriformis]
MNTTTATKANLKAWWKQFTAKNAIVKKSPDGKGKAVQAIFGVHLADAIEYASVPICMAGADGRQYVYGYIPTIVAKCGMFLKEHVKIVRYSANRLKYACYNRLMLPYYFFEATTSEGIFRLSGSAKRIKELQAIFDSSPSYGKTLTWTDYSVHDAANVLRRYLNHLPDPVIPQKYYEEFRSVFVNLPDAHDRVLSYKKLISTLPKENQHLLLYILDLLAVFSSKASQNLMPSKNLASIFQPGILSHEDHDMAPEQYKLSQKVLGFLIDHQNFFLMGLPQSQSPYYSSSLQPTRPPATSPFPIAKSSSFNLNRTNTMIEPPNLNNPQRRPSNRRSSFSMKRNDDGVFEPVSDSPHNSPKNPSPPLGRTTTLGRSRTLPSKTTKRYRAGENNHKAEDRGNVYNTTMTTTTTTTQSHTKSHNSRHHSSNNFGSTRSLWSSNSFNTRSATTLSTNASKPAKLRKKSLSRKMMQKQEKQERQEQLQQSSRIQRTSRAGVATNNSPRVNDENFSRLHHPKRINSVTAPPIPQKPINLTSPVPSGYKPRPQRQGTSESLPLNEDEKENGSVSSSSTNNSKRRRRHSETERLKIIARATGSNSETNITKIKEKIPFLLELRKKMGFGIYGGDSSSSSEEKQQYSKKIRHG